MLGRPHICNPPLPCSHAPKHEVSDAMFAQIAKVVVGIQTWDKHSGHTKTYNN